ncbi:hypothetical protein HOLleu_28539 [Holothuria leucospilota]|uniref:C2HC/C3H-type domain-containing protein n=1 Tax=Holothuria leucospilota TaxID=206669 RepID=A0A9Q1BM75_HOLLE|nr:hypothetical protein HOLleu_28539 [Holothuria leucospilota]
MLGTQLSPCSKCGLTFLPERVKQHEKTCGKSFNTLRTLSRNSASPNNKANPLHKSWPPPKDTSSPLLDKRERSSTTTLSRPSSVTLAQEDKVTISPLGASFSDQVGGGTRGSFPIPDVKESLARIKKSPGKPKATNTNVYPRRPPTVICYICGREFGSKSISIHEPQCLEKWKIENRSLPKHLRRKLPKKPDGRNEGMSMGGLSLYNESASQAAAAQLIPCENCGRTFAPDRLPVHQRSCKPHPLKNGSKSPTKVASGGLLPHPPPSKPPTQKPTLSTKSTFSSTQKPQFLVCYICGRDFGSKSLAIHEPQCLKKWHVQNKQLPKELRRPPPKKPQEIQSKGSQPLDKASINDAAWQSHKLNLVPCQFCARTFAADRIEKHRSVCASKGSASEGTMTSESNATPKPKPSAAQRPRTVICYICGREFGTKSISIHEPQCLKKWHIENDKLPHNLRRPEPRKPEVRPIAGMKGGQYDIEAMNEAAWEASKANLVPCPICGRTFLPDRLAVHQRSCKPKP